MAVNLKKRGRSKDMCRTGMCINPKIKPKILKLLSLQRATQRLSKLTTRFLLYDYNPNLKNTTHVLLYN